MPLHPGAGTRSRAVFRRITLFGALFIVTVLLMSTGRLQAQEGEPPVAPVAPVVTLAPLPSPAALTPAAGEAVKRTYLPIITFDAPEAAPRQGLGRAESAALFRNDYLAFQRISPGWTGSLDACNAGTITASYSSALLKLVNYFRTMAGVPTVTFDSARSSRSQKAALMMAANRALSHAPASSWRCYSADGSEAAGSSNLSLYGGYGSDYVGILGQMAEPGDGNVHVGHRRWILYPQTRVMGNGLVPPVGSDLGSNVLYVFDPENMWGPRPAVRDGFVAWPPPGYVPHQVVYQRWSYSYPGADFSGATVSMTHNGSAVAITVHPQRNGFGENTLVWTPQINLETLGDGNEHRFVVRLRNVRQDGNPVTREYDVFVFTP